MFPVVFGSSSVFPLLLYQTLSAGLFPLAVAELPLWGFLVFQINRFPAVLCLLGIFGFVLSFFLWLYAGKYQALYQDFHQIRDDSEEHTLLLSEKTRHFWKTGLRDLCCYIARAKQNCQRDP